KVLELNSTASRLFLARTTRRHPPDSLYHLLIDSLTSIHRRSMPFKSDPQSPSGTPTIRATPKSPSNPQIQPNPARRSDRNPALQVSAASASVPTRLPVISLVMCVLHSQWARLDLPFCPLIERPCRDTTATPRLRRELTRGPGDRSEHLTPRFHGHT